MSYHVAEELAYNGEDDDDCNDPTKMMVATANISMETRLVRAFLMADVNSRLAGLWTSGATVAVCLLKVRYCYKF
jgi:hypothetical protein